MSVIAEMDRTGFDPMPMNGVQQPFDDDRCQTPPSTRQRIACRSSFRAAGDSASPGPERPHALIEAHPRTALRVMRIIEEVVADPLGGGIVKPEPLQHDMAGAWSRRITDEHRMVYRIRGSSIVFAPARWHYARR